MATTPQRAALNSATLYVDGVAAMSCELATTWRRRMRGVLGRKELDTALWLEPANAVHTIGVHMPLDILYCRYFAGDTCDEGEPINSTPTTRSDTSRGLHYCTVSVIDYEELVPYRIGRPRKGCNVVVELAAGMRERLSIDKTSVLSVVVDEGVDL